jgi:GNAT superfamily N-acetyltransferase
VLELQDVPPDRLADRTADIVTRTSALRSRARHVDPEAARAQVEEIVAKTADLSQLLEVTDGDAVVGVAWLQPSSGGEFLVNDLHLDDPGRAPELVPLLVERARAAGARMIGVGVYPGEPSRRALAEQPGFLLRATNMALTLDRDLADSGGVDLQPMTDPEFEDFMAGNAEEYAGELVAAGMTEEAAAEQSTRQMAELLPQASQTPGMHFFTAWVGGAPVGSLWLAAQDEMAFVYDIVVRADQRRRGYGAGIMNSAAHWCRAHGHPVLGLNVFAHNPGARALYDGLGYRVTQDYHALEIPDEGA